MLLAMIAMMTSTIAYAGVGNGKGNGNGNGNGNKLGFEKHIEKFTVIDGERIKVKGNHVKFDVPPVIKEGRTLIPVRAITEAMGGEVEWDADNYIATIISPDGLIRIDFYLQDIYEDENDNGVFDEGDTMVTPGGTIIIYDKDGDDWVQREELGKTDVLPGLINNRTFVPLRFIAETFGLKVGYNPDNGQIDIDDPDEDPDEDPVEEPEPEISPTEFTYATIDDVPATSDISVITADYTLDEVVGLTMGVDYTTSTLPVADTTTEASLFIHLLESYVESLTDVETEVTVKLVKDTEVFEETVTIVLEYNDLEPAIDPEEAVFKGEDVQVTITPNGFTLDSIKVGSEDAEYVGPIGDVVEFDDAYLLGLLDEGESADFTFNFSKDTVEKSVVLTIESYDYDPKLVPEEVSYETIDDVPVTTDVDVITDGFAFVDLVDAEDASLVNPDDYEIVYADPADVDDVTVDVSFTIQLKEVYVEALTEEVTELEVKFIKGAGPDAEEVSKVFTIVLDYNHIEPTVDPTAADFDGVSDLDFDLVLNGYVLDDIKFGDDSATYTYDGAGPSVRISDLYLNSIITDEAVTLNFEFSLDEKEVVIPVVITPVAE